MKTSLLASLCGGLMLGASTFAGFAQEEKPTRSTRKVAVPAVSRLETLEIRTSKPRYLGGEPIVVFVSLVNKSTKPTSFLTLSPKLEWKVKRENKIVGLTYQGRDQSKGDKVSYRSVGVGQRFEDQVILNRVFDLSRAGDYVLSCEKYLKNENKEPGADLVGPRLVSKSIKFSVTEADFQAAAS